jgi:hypothetical protein
MSPSRHASAEVARQTRRCPKETVMGFAYNVIDADGHVVEPFSLWEEYSVGRVYGPGPP